MLIAIATVDTDMFLKYWRIIQNAFLTKISEMMQNRGSHSRPEVICKDLGRKKS